MPSLPMPLSPTSVLARSGPFWPFFSSNYQVGSDCLKRILSPGKDCQKGPYPLIGKVRVYSGALVVVSGVSPMVEAPRAHQQWTLGSGPLECHFGGHHTGVSAEGHATPGPKGKARKDAS